MATMNVNILDDLHAEIAQGDFTMLTNTSELIDPLTKSYGTSKLVRYRLEVLSVVGLNDFVLLHNGKNSRFSTRGVGSCQIKLTIWDEVGSIDTDLITITVI